LVVLEQSYTLTQTQTSTPIYFTPNFWSLVDFLWHNLLIFVAIVTVFPPVAEIVTGCTEHGNWRLGTYLHCPY